MCEKEQQLKLLYACTDWESLGDLYKLNMKIEYEKWENIRPYMKYLTYDSFDDEVPDLFKKGRYCTKNNVKEVEKLLDIAKENTVESREKRAQTRQEERRIQEEKINKLEHTLLEIFKEGNNDVSGNIILLESNKNNKTYCDTFNIYGGGNKFIVEPDYIWHILNNEADNDNWNYNNIVTGGAGAIGLRIDYRKEVHELIKEYTKLYKEVYPLN